MEKQALLYTRDGEGRETAEQPPAVFPSSTARCPAVCVCRY